MEYIDLLKYGFENTNNDLQKSRLSYLSVHIFDFVLYDSEMEELFAKKALEVSKAINDRTTFQYIRKPDNYFWFLVMCNMPFFYHKINYGSSIRGAWWDGQLSIDSCGLWDGDRQITNIIYFNKDEWRKFINDLLEFAEIK